MDRQYLHVLEVHAILLFRDGHYERALKAREPRIDSGRTFRVCGTQSACSWRWWLIAESAFDAADEKIAELAKLGPNAMRLSMFVGELRVEGLFGRGRKSGALASLKTVVEVSADLELLMLRGKC
jgi:hypothetical protein